MKFNNIHKAIAAAMLVAGASLGAPLTLAASTTVFFDDFDGNIMFATGVGGFVEGAGITDGQGLQGLGNPGNTFSGNVSRQSLSDVFSITLTNLPDHASLNLGFLFAALDTWDGSDVFPGGASPDFLNVTIDGMSIFQESFRNLRREDDPFCSANEICQSYVAPAGGQIATGGANPFGNIGFGGGRDGAYDMYLESAFQNIVHSGDSVVISFFGSGGGGQSIFDESIALDNITVSVNPVPVPPALLLFGSALALLGVRCRNRGQTTIIA